MFRVIFAALVLALVGGFAMTAENAEASAPFNPNGCFQTGTGTVGQPFANSPFQVEGQTSCPVGVNGSGGQASVRFVFTVNDQFGTIIAAGSVVAPAKPSPQTQMVFTVLSGVPRGTYLLNLMVTRLDNGAMDHAMAVFTVN